MKVLAGNDQPVHPFFSKNYLLRDIGRSVPAFLSVKPLYMIQTTIAAIRALSGALTDDYFYTTDANQEGPWRYEPLDTSSIDNTVTVLVTSDGKRIKRIQGSNMLNIKWFGAIGNGIANDTIAIQAAYDLCKATGNALFLPEGSYRVNTLQFNARVNVTGASTKDVIIRPITDNMTVINHYDSQDRSVGGYTKFTSKLSNFTIDASGKTGITGLRTYLTLASYFSQVSITGCDRYGLLAEGTQYSVFEQIVCELNYIGIRLLDDVSYNTSPANGGGVSNEFRTCTTRSNTIGVMLGRPGNPYPFNLNRFTNLISKSNKYTALYAINTGVSAFTELGAEANAYSPVASVTITNGGAGYASAPTVTFSAPGGSGTTATGTAVISGGVVTSVTITNPGSGYELVPTVTFSGGSPATAATAVANLIDQYTVTETLGNINGSPLTIVSVIKRSTVHADTSNLNFENYNHSQRNAQVYALNYSSLNINGMQGAVIYTTADDSSSIFINNGRGGNGSVLANTEVRQMNTPNYYAQFSLITAPRYTVNKFFMNETVQSKVPEYIAGATNTEIAPYTTRSPYGGALETKFYASVGSLTVNRVTLKLRPSNYANNDKIYVQCLVKANADTLLRASVGNNTVSPRVQLYAGKWKRIVMVNKNTSGSPVSNILQFYPLDTVGAELSICNVASCTNLSELDADLFIQDFQYNPNTPGGVDGLYLSAPPATGAWLKGDKVYNSNLTDPGQLGWICITTGSPGTWPPFAPIGAMIKTIKGTASGDGSTTVFDFVHGLNTTPGWVGFANPRTADAANAGVNRVDADATYLKVYVNTAPVAGTNNLIWDLLCKV